MLALPCCMMWHHGFEPGLRGFYPRRRNVTTSMVGLEKSQSHKNLTKGGELQRYSWGIRRRREDFTLGVEIGSDSTF